MDVKQQLEIIKRGAVEIISEEELKRKLEEKRPLKVKAGFDPTAPDIHLGHAVLLRKLRQFQELGHKVYFLIGDFTARIGDPSGRSEIRKPLNEKEVLENAKTYKRQVGKILDIEKIEVVFNSHWFLKMSVAEILKLTQRVTVSQMLGRQDFRKRLEQNKDVTLLEFMYPVLQGYDSVMLESDIEIGGTDQLFNLLVGRDLQKDFGQSPQVVITLPLLEGTDGVNKMSKTLGNYIAINDKPNEIFGKVMSISDDLMWKYYELLTDEDLGTIKTMHPKEAKLRLAQNLAEQYHSRKDAGLARSEFERVFSSKEMPQDMPEYKTDGKETVINILLNSGLVKSGNEARRLIKQGAAFFNNFKITEEGLIPQQDGILKVGTRRFLKISVKSPLNA